MTGNLCFDSLSHNEQIETAWSAIEDEDENAREILSEHAHHHIKNNTHHPKGEPSASIECDICCTSIPIDSEAAAVKQYACEHKSNVQPTTDTELVCSKCADATDRLVNPGRTSVVATGELKRRRVKPGDECSAPYLFYLEPENQSFEFIQPGAQTAFGWGSLNQDSEN